MRLLTAVINSGGRVILNILRRSAETDTVLGVCDIPFPAVGTSYILNLSGISIVPGVEGSNFRYVFGLLGIVKLLVVD